MKYIDIHYHFIHEKIKDGMIEVIYYPTNKMTANILTKPLSSYRFKPLIHVLGLISA